MALPVSAVSQLASQDYKNDRYFRGPDMIFDRLRETSIMVFVLIHLMYHCEGGFFVHLLVCTRLKHAEHNAGTSQCWNMNICVLIL